MAEPSITCLTLRNSCFTQQPAFSLSLFFGFSPSTKTSRTFAVPETGTNVAQLRGKSGFETRHPNISQFR